MAIIFTSHWCLKQVSWKDMNPVNPANHCQRGILQIQLLVSRKTGTSLLPEDYQIGNVNLQLALAILCVQYTLESLLTGSGWPHKTCTFY